MKDFFPAIPSRKQPPPKPKKIIRIMLGEATSQALDETGLPAFAVCGCERPAGQPKRWILYLAETRNPAAMKAIEIMKQAANQQNQP
jgi:hypothetical protein